MKPLTPRQRDALQAICEHQSRFGYFPTVREIAQMLGLRAPSSVQSLVNELRHKRYLDRAGVRGFVIRQRSEVEDGRFVQRLTATRGA